MHAELADAAQALTLLVKVPWADEPGPALVEPLETSMRLANLVDANRVAVIRSFAAKYEHRNEGHSSPVGWIQHHCHVKKRTAQRLWRLTRFVAKVPAAEAALGRGDIGLDHIEVLADAYKDTKAEAWAEAEPLLVEYAAEGRFEDFARQVQRFADLLSPKDAEDRFEEQLAGRRFSKATTIDGYGYLKGWMEPVLYAIFSTELDRLERIEFEADWATARDVLGRDPTNIELEQITRTQGQRYHDALGIMAQRSKALAGGKVAAAADVILHCDQDSYETALARLLGDDEAEYPTDGFCETEEGTVISPVAAVYLSLIGHIRRIVFSADGEILSHGRGKRLFTPAQAAALRAKFRRCNHPYGCDKTGPLLQSDHVCEWKDGGPTDCRNGQCLCAFHNRWKTNHSNGPPGPPPDSTRPDTGQRRAPPPDLC